MFGNNYKKNSKRLASTCEHYIDLYESKKATASPSCKKDMMDEINTRIMREKDDIAKWKDYDTDYIKIAHTLIAHTSFDLLASGRYHLYLGVLNPMSCSSSLMTVYENAMQWAVDIGIIDNDTLKEQKAYLLQCISKVG